MKKFFVVFVLVFLGVISYIPNASAAGKNNWDMIMDQDVGQNRRYQGFVNVFHRESNYVRVAIFQRLLKDGKEISNYTLYYDFLKNKPACRRLEEYIDNNGKEYVRPKGTGEWDTGRLMLDETLIAVSQWLNKKKYINWVFQKP